MAAMKIKINIPGPGGSLGECVICGQAFIAECLGLGNVLMMGMNGGELSMPVHISCFDNVKDIHDYRQLPDGPLRRAIAADDPAEAGLGKEGEGE